MNAVAVLLGATGTVSAALAIWNERRMQRHRQPGVSYARATLRWDGGWRRGDLFTPEGLRCQRRAAMCGFGAALLWALALAWAAL